MMQQLDRTLAPSYHPITDLTLVQAQTHYLSNGLPVHVVHAGTQPIVSAELVFPAGNWYEPAKGVAFFLSKMLTEGTQQRSGADLMEAFSAYGSFLQVSHSQDHFYVHVYSLRRYLRPVLALLCEVITEASLPADELENIRKIQLQNLQVNRQKTSFMAGRAYRNLIFGDAHPYGGGAQEEDLAAITQPQLQAYYEERIQSLAGADLILSGDCDATVLAEVEATLGQLTRQPLRDSPAIPPVPPAAKRHETIAFPASLQSTVRMGQHLFTKDHPDLFRFKVLNEVFGGYFGSRLMKNIREEKGFTYGIYSGYSAFLHAGLWVIGADVKKEATLQTLEEIYHEMDVLRQELIPENELTTVRNYMLGSLAGSITTPFALADKFKSIYYHNLGYDYYDRFVDTIRTVTAEELRETARLYFDPEKLVEAIAGGRE
ncbi:Predicted Zn-dependent peptidase [Catalinimonas alkaloidigena]|uniref:Predicted Zn-dependent peptidase n=1 Tax=Catalinimonas alkaloidigena TaxID=1075417 RepID=A0A1G9M0Y6_9BACT|nr:pitrilysin family protein [Catalinimonas alkaloidigena]SDL67909.1 Predicted Zn-dependent peptidase [Catalinimonas alkaloidigena]